ncbi:putative addiction module killer protein [Bartonella fuyuanensis]|uniref:Putative addiction module killer protein n=1 Tax=Bartonella fuyuanensis TaxID=1460968 RepID=A0A840E271_9HYPH|nr:type II toxin-antitoxin system RelE/ParE family toxin [Bartonella fuyuanensis]MBB4077077.1 putative addiction module killer protein [Bartonella fuyuanensis]
MVAIIKTTDEFDEWLEKLKDRKAADIILTRLHRIRSGLLGDVKFFNGIGELRIHYGTGYRIYFTKKGDKIVILLWGGNKSTQSNDIQKALSILEDLKNEIENL